MSFLRFFIAALVIAFCMQGKAQNANNATEHIPANSAKVDTLIMKPVLFGYAYFMGGQEVEKSAFVKQLKTNPEAYHKYAQGRGLVIVGNLIGIPAGFVLGFNLGKIFTMPDTEINKTLLYTSAGITVAGVILTVIGDNKKEMAIRMYNGELNKVSLGLSSTGFGLALRF